MDRKTVRAYAYAESFPERAPRPFSTTVLHPYLDYLEKRHAEGCENASKLYREIQELGFIGTRWHVLNWTGQAACTRKEYAWKSATQE